ncbi:CPBP family glutamic-type intramembrane protease [Pirellulaceae bacterium SH501]
MNSWTVLESFDFPYQAETVRVILQHEGIECALENQFAISTDWLLSNAAGGVKLLVPTEDLPRARTLLIEFRETQKTNTDDETSEKTVIRCPRCKEVVAFPKYDKVTVDNCLYCRSYIDVPVSTSDEFDSEQIKVAIEKAATYKKTSRSQIENRWYLVFEILVVLSFAYLPVLLNAISYLRSPVHSEAEADLNLYSDQGDFLVLRSTLVLATMIPIVLYSGASWRSIGCNLQNWRTSLLLVVPVVALALLFNVAILSLLVGTIKTPYESVATDIPTSMWANYVLGILLNSLAEELVMRGYLIHRLTKLFGSTVVSVGISSFLFASYHISQGPIAVVSVFMIGILYGIWFLKSGSLLGPILAHTLYNLTVEFLWTG